MSEIPEDLQAENERLRKQLAPPPEWTMDFPEAFAYIAENAPDKESHHPKCSYRVAGMLCDCAILWAEYYRRKCIKQKVQAEQEKAALRAQVARLTAPVSEAEWGAIWKRRGWRRISIDDMLAARAAAEPPTAAAAEPDSTKETQ